MQLSESMGMGRVLLKPRPFLLLTDDGTGGCALGMAGKATGTQCTFDGIAERWPWLVDVFKTPQCPVCQEPYVAYFILIGHIFDHHVMVQKDWNFDQLIDWVRSVEPPEETATESYPVQIEQAVSA